MEHVRSYITMVPSYDARPSQMPPKKTNLKSPYSQADPLLWKTD